MPRVRFPVLAPELERELIDFVFNRYQALDDEADRAARAAIQLNNLEETPERLEVFKKRYKKLFYDNEKREGFPSFRETIELIREWLAAAKEQKGIPTGARGFSRK